MRMILSDDVLSHADHAFGVILKSGAYCLGGP